MAKTYANNEAGSLARQADALEEIAKLLFEILEVMKREVTSKS